jgi:hypothetical protein
VRCSRGLERFLKYNLQCANETVKTRAHAFVREGRVCERITGVHRDIILRLLLLAGEKMSAKLRHKFETRRA